MRTAAALVALLLAGADARATTPPAEPPAVAEAARLLDGGDPAGAARRLEALLATQPRSGERAYALLAAARHALGSPSGALAASEAGLALYPTSARLRGLDARLLEEALPPPEREERIERRLAEGRAGPEHRRALAQLRIAREPRDPRAGELLEQALAEAPRDPATRFLYGQWLCLTRKEARCVEELESTLRLAPDNDEARFQALTLIAHAQDRLGREAESEAAYRQAWAVAERLPSPSPVALHRYVQFLLVRDRNEEAEQRIDRLLTRAPGYAPAHFDKARQLSRRGDLASAAAVAKRALELAADDLEQLRAIHVFLARTYFALGDEASARVHQDWVRERR